KHAKGEYFGPFPNGYAVRETLALLQKIFPIRQCENSVYRNRSAFIAEQAGADGITVHLREDRRHITDRDVRILRQTLHTRMNL
ncbi:pyridoxine 5'-phosphate synthase, partial [Salmonella enterica subsp. enterica serovar Virginia]|nr:pyridoxine 5'-phosphate synthase [Salmonella enterica subsp. enterica serovar Virginia]